MILRRILPVIVATLLSACSAQPPSMGRNLDRRDTPHFDERVRQRFPVGSDESQLEAELRSEQFSIAEIHDPANRLRDPLFPTACSWCTRSRGPLDPGRDPTSTHHRRVAKLPIVAMLRSGTISETTRLREGTRSRCAQQFPLCWAISGHATVNTTKSPDCEVLTYSREIFPDKETLSAGAQAERTIIIVASQPIEGGERQIVMGLPIEGDHVTGIRQTSGEFALDTENCQTPADSVCSPFSSLARRAAEQDLPWRDAPWLVRLFTTLTFSHLLELSRIDEAASSIRCRKSMESIIAPPQLTALSDGGTRRSNVMNAINVFESVR
jgi:hypothetical protein